MGEFLRILIRHAGHQELVEAAVGGQQGWDTQVPDLLQGVFPGTLG